MPSQGSRVRIRLRRLNEIQKFIRTRKDRPCADCGLSYPYYVMDFDHRDPSTKLFQLSHSRQGRRTLLAVAAEIEKCDVVCANCHRQRTYEQSLGRFGGSRLGVRRSLPPGVPSNAQ